MRLSKQTTVLSALWALAMTAPLSEFTNGLGVDTIPSKYIVQFKPGSSTQQHLSWVNETHVRRIEKRQHSLAGLDRQFSIGDISKVYTGEVDHETIALIEASSDVLSVEQDQMLTLPPFMKTRFAAEPSMTDRRRGRATSSSAPVPLGLRYVSRRPLAEGDSHGSPTDAREAYACLVGTGVYFQHRELEGRAQNSYNVAGGSSPPKSIVGHQSEKRRTTRRVRPAGPRTPSGGQWAPTGYELICSCCDHEPTPEDNAVTSHQGVRLWTVVAYRASSSCGTSVACGFGFNQIPKVSLVGNV